MEGIEIIKERVLKNKKGNGVIYACIIVLLLMLLFSTLSEYLRLQMIAKGVRNALQTSIISVATQNYDDIYNGIREGYSGGYKLNNSRWEKSIDIGNVYYHLDNTLGLRNDGSHHIKISNGKTEFSLSNLNIKIINSPLAPTKYNTQNNFKAEGKILLEVPLGFGWGMLPPMKINLKVTSGYISKF